MKLNIEIFKECQEIEVSIRCKEVDNQIKKAIDILKQRDMTFTVKKDDITKIIKVCDIYYFESVDNRTFAYTSNDVYLCQKKLYEIDKILLGTSFVRISKSCILNTDSIDAVRASLNGKLECTLSNNEKIMINRHYVPEFKKKFDI